MNKALKTALAARLTALTDDELILAHRNAAWTGHAPILEVDIALANIAQDELGHATLFFTLLQDLTGSDPDRMAFFRDAPAFYNAQMVELPKGDWAFTMLRQYLFDAYEYALLNALVTSSYPPLAGVAAKIRPEEIYHLRHSHLWVERLGLGTEESNRRMQDALNTLWPYHAQLFQVLPNDAALVKAGYMPDVRTLKSGWSRMVRSHLETCELTIPVNSRLITDSRTHHTLHLDDLLIDMQKVASLDPQAEL